MRVIPIVSLFCIMTTLLSCSGNSATKTAPLLEKDSRAGKLSSENALQPSEPLKQECLQISGSIANQFPGWELSLPIQVFDQKSIFDYIDGAAELYFAYDFKAAAAAEYKSSETSIMVEVYDMTTSKGAFGIYSLNRYPGANYVDTGNEGILDGNSLDFWKGKYYCKVYCFSPEHEYQKVVLSFGGRLAMQIKDAGAKPDILKKVPQRCLVAGSVRYFSRKLALDNIHFVSKENVLNLGALTSGVVVRYNVDGNAFDAFVISYPSADDAKQAYEKYVGYLVQKGGTVVVRSEAKRESRMVKMDGKLDFVRVEGPILLGFWDVSGQKAADSFVDCLE